ncbi:hypothetical protein B0A48_15562 [Cryoendolithus antarcticus]|uniref:Uncharacterized protein n=1 Tax=Cryoendolithus antarcticus TaxID=1507870 RepID=A0A1V8SGS1_9PEZI|nr:hypothetical protein B0A48_15562 [Cryoendolithus antarcticus]
MASSSTNPPLRRFTEACIPQTRSSTDTDCTHLLAPSLAPSVAPSSRPTTRAPSPSGTLTPRASSASQGSISSHQHPSTPQSEQPYRGFPSRAAYLTALQTWAESKKDLEASSAAGKELKGFYGEVTMAEIAGRPRVKLEGLGLRKRWRERRERGKNGAGGEVGGERRATIV